LSSVSGEGVPSPQGRDIDGKYLDVNEAELKVIFQKLSVPWGPSTLTYKHQVKTPAPTSQLGAAPGLPRVPATPAPASWFMAAPGPPRAPVAPAPGPGQLWGRHVSPGLQHPPSGSWQL
jgi:hypothetical protein